MHCEYLYLISCSFSVHVSHFRRLRQYHNIYEYLVNKVCTYLIVEITSGSILRCLLCYDNPDLYKLL